MWTFFHKLASPPHFYRIAAALIPWFAVPGYLLIAYGAYAGLFHRARGLPAKKMRFRIIYVHVPSAYLSMMAYMIMGNRWRHRPDLAHEARPCGGGERRAARRIFHFSGARDRLHLGSTDVGHLVGVGAIPDLCQN